MFAVLQEPDSPKVQESPSAGVAACGIEHFSHCSTGKAHVHRASLAEQPESVSTETDANDTSFALVSKPKNVKALAAQRGFDDGKLLYDSYGDAVQDAFDDALYCDVSSKDIMLGNLVRYHHASFQTAEPYIKDKNWQKFYDHYVPALCKGFVAGQLAEHDEKNMLYRVKTEQPSRKLATGQLRHLVRRLFEHHFNPRFVSKEVVKTANRWLAQWLAQIR